MKHRRLLARVFFAFAAFIGCAANSSSAAAQEGVRGERYRMRLQMEEHYTAEWDGALVVGVQGLVSMGASGVLFGHGDPMARGAAWPVLIGGGLGVLCGFPQMIYLSNKRASLRKELAEKPELFRASEMSQRDKDSRFYSFFELLEVTAVLTGAGVLTYGELKREPVATGVGAGLIVEGMTLLGVTYLAQKRTDRYVRALRDFQPDVAVSRDTVALTLRGVF